MESGAALFDDAFLVRSYSDILNGYTIAYLGEGRKRQSIYIKHFDYKDIHQLELLKNVEEHRLSLKKIKTEDELKEEFNKQKKWTKKDDETIFLLQDSISRFRETKSKMPLEKDRLSLQNTIDGQEKELKEKQDKLNSLFAGRSREYFLNKKANNFYVYLSFYEDKEFKKQIFTPEKREDLDEDEFYKYILIYHNSIGLINDQVIKNIAIKWFFTNSYKLAKTPYEFMGKPVSLFTNLQTKLCSYGNDFKHILSNLDSSTPEEVLKDPDKLIEWFMIKQETAKQGTKAPIGKTERYVGAKSRDMLNMGKAPMTAANVAGMMAKKP